MEQYQKLAQEAYGDDAPKFIETSFYAKMPTHLKRVLNQARLETESYERMVQHIEREMELNGLLAPNETNITGVIQIDALEPQQATNPPKPSGPCYGCGQSGHVIKNCRKVEVAIEVTGCPTKLLTHAKLVARKATPPKNATQAPTGQNHKVSMPKTISKRPNRRTRTKQPAKWATYPLSQ